MRLYGVRVFVDDLAAARDFYVDTLGLRLAWDGSAEHGAFGVDVDGAEIVVEEADEAARAEGLVGRFVGLSLSVDDVERRHLELAEKGVEFTEAPQAGDRGPLIAHFRDPSGNVLTLVGPMRF